MKYAYSRADLPSEDLASGRVLFSRPGFTAFPVHLASELFLQAISLLARSGRLPPYNLYDPTWGGGHLATTLSFLHGGLLRAISMSDISDEAVALAIKNAALLTPEGLPKRRAELCELAKRHGRESHLTACRSAARPLPSWQRDGIPQCRTAKPLALRQGRHLCPQPPFLGWRATRKRPLPCRF